MQNWIRVVAPVGIGLAAGVMNWMAVQAKLEPVAFTAVNLTIERGGKIYAGDLVRVEVAGDTRKLLRAALPWEERSTAYSALATRPLASGDLVLLADATASAKLEPGDGEQKTTLTLPREVPLSTVFAEQWVSVYLRADPRDARRADEASRSSFGSRPRERRETIGPFLVAAVAGDPTPGLVGEESREREGEHTLSLIVPDGPDAKRLLSASSRQSGEQVLGLFVSEEPRRSVALAAHAGAR